MLVASDGLCLEGGDIKNGTGFLTWIMGLSRTLELGSGEESGLELWSPRKLSLSSS